MSVPETFKGSEAFPADQRQAMTDQPAVRAIRRWKSVPSNLRPDPIDFDPLPFWRFNGAVRHETVAKLNGGLSSGWLSSEEVREVAEYVYRYVASTVTLQYAAALGVSPNWDRLRRFREEMAPLVEAARDAAARPERGRLAAVLDYCRREGVNPF